jgi:small subunit ribosomal protein S19e
MTTVYDVNPEALIFKTAEDLKDKVEEPEWAKFVKTGVSKERPPEQENWWYIREASLLRKIYVKGPIGISRLRSLYTSKKNNGVMTEHTARAGGKVIRTAVQQLESLGFVKKNEDGGREITSQGKSYIDNLSKQVA